MINPDDHNDIEDLLRSSRPVPDAAWRGSLRRELTAPKSTWQRLRRVQVASLAVAATAAAFIVAGLLGGGPLSGLGDEPTSANDNCRYVISKVERRVPIIVQGQDGPEVQYEQRVVSQRVKRCD